MAARKSLQELALTSKKYSYRNSPDYSNTSTSITEWRRNPAWLPMPGFNYTIDNTFGDASAFSVFTGIKQSDDKLIFGGAFNSIGSTGSKYIGRINSNGSYDSSFNVGTGFNAFVRTLALQSDGKVLVGGQFSSYDGTTANGIIRLNSTGSVDTSFNIGTGFDDEVYRITIQPDNKILVGGFFTSYNGTTVNKLVRLNTDGSLDTSFSTTRTGSGFSGAITSILVTPDRILVGGSFNSFDGSGARTYFLGLKNDGSYDTTYNSSNAGPNGTVRNIAQQTNGKIIITGSFSTWTTTGANTVIAGGIARINTDGSIDTSFRTGSGDPSSTGQSVTVSSDDYIYFGGFFTTFNGYTSKRLARLNPDGSFDTSFNIGTGADNTVYGTIIESTGKPIVYGAFTSFQGTGYGLIRLAATEEKISILKSVHANSDFTTLQFEGNYTINWGDGNTENLAANTLAFHQYDYANTNLANTNGPVTFTDTGDLVTRTAHGYANTDIVTFYTISNTTGITVDTPYYVANSTANTFQLSNTSNGSIVSLTTDGTGTLLPYKQVLITITPQAGANLTNVILNTANTTALTSGFESNFLDISASVPNVTNKIGVGTFSVGSTTQATKMNRLERVSFHNTANVTSMNNMFYNCSSLQSVPLFDTAKVTNMDTMFNNCYSLQSVPLFNTANVNTMSTMFYYCYSLQSVPLFNTANVTSMNNMFQNCTSLQSVPLFDTAKVTSMNNMFQGCTSLQSVPLFNTANVTNMSGMFYFSYSLQSVPLFDTAKVTNMSFMFVSCNSLQSVPLFNTANVTNMDSMIYSCLSLQSVPLFNTANVTSMFAMFSGCYSLKSVPAFNANSVTNFAAMFGSARLTRSQLANTKYSISYADQNLSGNSLNEIYTNLPTVTAQTITVTGNWGTATDDPTIATAKGWTVTG